MFGGFKNKETLLIFAFFATLLLWCTALALPIELDIDLWARLIAGKSIVENGIILKHDFYSFTQTLDWIDHEWGASALIYWFSSIGKYFHISAIKMLLILKLLLTLGVLTLSVLCVKMRETKASSPYQILYFALAIFAMNYVFYATVRCHMFTFFLFTLTIFLLELYRIKNKKWALAILPLIVLLWTNIHGGVLSGLGIIGLYGIGELLNKKKFLPYFLTLFVSLIVLFINPYGFAHVKFLFWAGTMNREWITEWASPIHTAGSWKFLEYFAFMAIVATIRVIQTKFDIKNADKTKILLLVATATAALLHTKLVPFFVITSSIFLFDDIYTVLKSNRFKAITDPCNKWCYFVIIILALLKLSIISTFGGTIKEPDTYEALQFIKENKLSGNILVDMSYGSMFAYKLYPQNKIFMDGRYEEVYDPKLLLVMKDFFRAEGKKPYSILTDYPIDIIVFKDGIEGKTQAKLQELKWRSIFKGSARGEICSSVVWHIFVSPAYKLPKLKQISLYPFNDMELLDTPITKEILQKVAEEDNAKDSKR